MALTTNSGADSAVRGLKANIRGQVIQPGDDGYDEARTVYNAMIDRRPAVVVRPTGAADVMAAVDFAREHDLVIAVKGGGHNVAGNAVCDGGLQIDLCNMTSVRVDTEARTVHVGPGARLGDVDHETAPLGLVAPAGVVSITGVAGLALGGGFGYLCRKHGLTIDNLRSIDLVTAQGELVHASAERNPDLFWGVRGGSGNFGIVTNFEFALHELEGVLAGLLIYPAAEAHSVVRSWWEHAANAPDELSVWLNFSTAAPEPFIPEVYHGKRILSVIPIFSGAVEDGWEAIAPFKKLGTLLADTVEPWRFVEWQQAFDASYPAGERYFWKSHNFKSPSAEALDCITDHAISPPTPETRVSVTHLGGAVNRVPSDATAYPHRDADFLVNITTRWQSPNQDDACIGWTREYFEALAPHATGGTYVNFTTESDGEQSMAYLENYDRLVALKNKWDPDNLFRLNQNIKPTV
ncbi:MULTISPECIES: FAD-binding oxidoreductase [unclassified Haladaptatus]|uniref:FAD-binding oxidoreductase n=1 Tax=unclassified Haladaptatus TaxID=2622732 RepID=UPI0023E7C0A5|nr:MULTISPECIES: FAD-binding oxidoreductase [unclassified Haladaptatus]